MYRDRDRNRLSVSSAVSEDTMPNHTQPAAATGMHRSRQASTCSEHSCEGMTADETRHLWRCMLELQQRYGCYNSTRLDVAVDAGEGAMDLMRVFQCFFTFGILSTDILQPAASSSTRSTNPSSTSPTRAASC